MCAIGAAAVCAAYVGAAAHCQLDEVVGKSRDAGTCARVRNSAIDGHSGSVNSTLRGVLRSLDGKAVTVRGACAWNQWAPKATVDNKAAANSIRGPVATTW